MDLIAKSSFSLSPQGIPTLVYRHDWNFEHLFMDIKNKMAQVVTISPHLQGGSITYIGGSSPILVSTVSTRLSGS